MWQFAKVVGTTGMYRRNNMDKWYICPYCNKKLVKYKKGANSNGVFLLCKNCKKEIEIKINKDKN